MSQDPMNEACTDEGRVVLYYGDSSSRQDGSSTPGQYAVARIFRTPNDDRKRVGHAVLSNGNRIDIKRTYNDDRGGPLLPPGRRLAEMEGMTWDLFFSGPLPDWSDEECIAYAKAMTGDTLDKNGFEYGGDWDKPAVFLVDKIMDRVASAYMVSTSLARSYKDGKGHECYHFHKLDSDDIISRSRRLGSLWVSDWPISLDIDKLPAGTSSGDVIVGGNLKVSFDTGTPLISMSTPVILPRKATLDNIESFLPEDRKRKPGTEIYLGFNPEPIASLMHTIEVARAALDPNEALVVVFPDETNPESGSEHIGIMMTRGALFYSDMGEAHDSIAGKRLQPGIYHVTEPKLWSERRPDGEWDGGFEFVSNRANLQSLKTFGLDVDAVRDMIKDYLDDEDKTVKELAEAGVGTQFSPK